MKYRANPVIVDAFVIEDKSEIDEKGNMQLLLGNEEEVTANGAMTARYIPNIGDYWVVQEDGYAYLNPKDVFERKYSPLLVEPAPEDKPMEVAPEQASPASQVGRDLRAPYAHLPK